MIPLAETGKALLAPSPALAPRTRGAQVAHAIEQEIRRHGWRSGQLIGSEPELGDRFGVGSAAVREAVRVLEARGLAKARRGPGGGLFVTAPDRALVTDAARRYLEHAGVGRASLFEVWLALEQLAVVKLARDIDVEQAGQLRRMLAEAVHKPAGTWSDVPNIHLEIARMSGNVALELFIGVLTELSLHRYGPGTDAHAAAGWLHAQHAEIIEAVIAGDAGLAQLHLRRYIEAIERHDLEPTGTPLGKEA